MGGNVGIKTERKAKEEQFRAELANLKHIEWLQNNMDKYKMGMWTQLKEPLQEEIRFDNYDTMKERYSNFIDHFENNPYAYSFPIEGNGGKIVSEYPDCYFVLIEVEEKEGKRSEHVSIGFLKECIKKIQTENEEDGLEKLDDLIKRFLDKEKKMFWIHTYSKVERVYLKNYYECYKEEWKVNEDRKNQEGNTKKLNKRMFFIIAMICMLMASVVSLLAMNISLEEYLIKLLILLGMLAAVEFCFSYFPEHKRVFYRKAIEEYKKDDEDDQYMYNKCCREVNSIFLPYENQPLNIMDAKGYLAGLEKRLRITNIK